MTKRPRPAAAIQRFVPYLLCTLLVSAACSGEAATATGEKKEMPKEEVSTLLGRVTQVRLDEPRSSVRLPVATSGPAADRLRRALARPAGPAAAELTLDGMAVSQPPGVQFNVYLANAGANPRRQYVGTLSFFGVGPNSGTVALPDRTFDVTEQLQALKGQSPQLSEVQVVFEATDGTQGSTPEKAGASLNRHAGLRIGSVRLQVQGKP